MRKKVWVAVGDIILVSLRDYQDAKADVILKYSADEARNLKTYGELPVRFSINYCQFEISKKFKVNQKLFTVKTNF